MELILLCVGKTRASYLGEGINDYTSRINRFSPFKVIEIPDIKNAHNMPTNIRNIKEGEKILSQLCSGDRLILLDERGPRHNSMEFSSRLSKWLSAGGKRLIFCIGGPFGFSEELYDRAEGLVSLSPMTFNHEMVRLFFTEQLYRAFSILNGSSYHHE